MKENLTLKQVANRSGVIIILFFIFTQYVYFGLCKVFRINDINVVNSTVISFSMCISLIVPSLILLNVNFIYMFTNKNKVYKSKINSIVWLIMFTFSLYIIIATFNYCGLGWEKVQQQSEIDLNTAFKSRFELMVVAGIIGPILEEVFFRGILLENLKRYGVGFSIITSAFLFGTVHNLGFFKGFLMGIITGVIYIYTGNIKWTIVFHIMVNFGASSVVELIIMNVFPNISEEQAYITVGVLCIPLCIISYFKCKKNEHLLDLYSKCNLKKNLVRIKKDKNSYLNFFISPSIFICLLIFAVNFIYYLVC